MANLNEDDFFYDVFLSFRGGTRYGFTNDLYEALRQKGMYIFRDSNELRIGAEIRPSLVKAIEKSRMWIVVLCEDYASSTWCLDELAHIIRCYHANKGKQILLIFYKVEPSHVWEQKEKYAKAMIEHEKRFGKDFEEKVKIWRKALSETRHLTAEHCKDDLCEPGLIEKIVKDTYAKLPAIPLPIKHVVGIDSRFQEVKPIINIESHDTVCILEIYGAGGIGKTTFALNIYNNIRHHFQAGSFLANVREKSNKSSKGLEDLQKTLLSEMGEKTEIMMGNTFNGANEIKGRLSRKKVLLVLDDVGTIKQLESLVGGGDWFGTGSRIIITTRDTTLLDEHVINGVIIQKYEMKELNERDSLELFCWHAFKKSAPEKNFEEVSNLAVLYAKGLPLALKVIGSNLKDRSLKDWKMELNKYENILNDKIQKVLEISYHSLYDLDQKIFLDIACFFKGEKWEYVERILRACDFFPSIQIFIAKCLITIDENGCLDMHDLIQDMGREIVRKESSNVGDRSRLWSHKEVLRVLKENSGSNRIEAIMLDPPSHVDVYEWTDTAFEMMKNLRILIIRNTSFSKAPSYLPNTLRLLDWKGYPSKSFPPQFYPQRIVDFKLPHSFLMLEKPFQKFEDLTFINLSQCQSITRIPNVSGAINLKVLTLDRCHKVEGFDKSIGFMPKLVYLSASRCNKLKSFVCSMNLPYLEVLSFNFCTRFERFPDVKQKMDKPLKIYLVNTAIKEFPKSISNLTGLEYLDISSCTRLKNLPSNLLLLPKLVTLLVDGCSQIGESFKRFRERHSIVNGWPNLTTLHLSETNLSNEELCAILKGFPKMEALKVSYNDLVSLPACTKGSLHLKSLDMSHCNNLRSIPELPLSIQKVNARYCWGLTSQASKLLLSKVSLLLIIFYLNYIIIYTSVNLDLFYETFL
uniref:TMV resistance protein N n=1 Tax=Cajanus cajan TaxID=3821 RepID=A0A151REM0_CAJCA|nr:TMV resistance protein N [Cajanus cajan]